MTFDIRTGDALEQLRAMPTASVDSRCPPHTETRGHPLAADSLFCPPHGIVLDPFAGSGSTGCAAMRAERSFLGIEIDPAMAAIARGRIADAYAQGVPQRIEGVA